MRAGDPTVRGVRVAAEGLYFGVYSSVADAVELCLFDADGRQYASHRLPACDDGVWHGFLPGGTAGMAYGYRVHGPYDPAAGLRCNPAKLLIDPYARELAGEFRWHDAVFAYRDARPDDVDCRDLRDSAPYVPRCRVSDRRAPAYARPAHKPAERIVYELNVRGYTMQHPDVDVPLRGTFDALRAAAVVDHLRSLGVTCVELMPVHAFVDEQHLVDKGLRNLWGYNSLSFFAPAPRLASATATADAIAEFQALVRTFHEANIEVILDVVYNHTAEGDQFGPTVSLRGLDNATYYRLENGDPAAYINDTGCGNTINADHPEVQQLIVSSLRYWHREMGVDGFRFDLAPILGRHAAGFSPAHPLLHAIDADPSLRTATMIAEPWDPGPGGYQLGRFPLRFGEWNDRYRDALRQFWCGAANADEFATGLRGSADLFDTDGRPATASVNFVSAHDGFTLADAVSFVDRHNEANGEGNRDGHAHNYSCNHGIEGPTSDPAVNALRRRHRLNLLATVLVSQGTPMLLGGDEFGNSQSGNNNAYAQDNETGWVDWSGLDDDPDFTATVAAFVRLRQRTPLLRWPAFLHAGDREVRIEWLAPDGTPLPDNAWAALDAWHLRLAGEATLSRQRVSVIINRGDDSVRFDHADFRADTDANRIATTAALQSGDGAVDVPGFTIATIVTKA